ncbi:zf-C3HC4 type zinc finger protein [Kwoniella heveanensis BCC8398]|uniref:Zf-C3HC4 type zinc finger protein n=1 Tax=Kwoniella heveanensis BCC8398 TaxID=1296120 RepID=A0A1B9GWP2_9TREE|nr:zf-C3HC4 type zinc finger protein [Kwoniella heveanensis BCC8398]
MGNASSSQGGTPSASATATNSASAPEATSTPSRAAPTASQPISTSSRPAVATSTAFHSGITPPTSPPSPPPPGTPVLLPFAGHLSPQNPHCLSHPQAHDYSKSTVTRLIIEGKLAPFYRGLEDYEEEWTEDDIGRILNEMREKDYEEGVENSYTEHLKEEREGTTSTVGSVAKKIRINRAKEQRKEDEKEERARREKKAYANAVECPICFLNYPPNINTSRCCQQPVCTECFVQMKRSEATITHLESDPACCPFCMETDFGVIYERPLGMGRNGNANASGFSQALSLGSESELSLGPGMNPKMKETVRRKSVSSKAKEVVTIDEIRPDWEQKLNTVKAAAARRASRRIVMRQVGDRLIPIGYTSSRAPGTADFSMSVGQNNNNDESGAGSRRGSRRRESNRERELEELMIMEAMRLSLVDHEDHQRKMADERRKSSVSSVSSPLNPANASVSSTSGAGPSSLSTPNYIIQAQRGSNHQAPPSSPGRRGSAPTERVSGASKLLSKINNVRARANSAASSKNGESKSVSFASPTTPPSGPGSASPSAPNSRPASVRSPETPTFAPVQVQAPVPTQPQAQPQRINHGPGFGHGHMRTPSSGTGLSPTSPAPVAVAPVTTLASPGAERGQHLHSNLAAKEPSSAGIGGKGSGNDDSNSNGNQGAGLPRLSLDMPALTPEPVGAHNAAGAGGGGGGKGKMPQRQPLERMESEMSEATIGPSTYAQLDSDDEVEGEGNAQVESTVRV